MFVIGLNNKYYAADPLSGNYPHWTHTLAQAKFFNTREEASKILEPSKYSDFYYSNKMSNGIEYPPLMIRTGLDINSKNPKASGIIEILEISLTPVVFMPIQGEIKYPVSI